MEMLMAFMQRRFYYGWVIVGLAMVSMSFWYAFRTTFSIFASSMLVLNEIQNQGGEP